MSCSLYDRRQRNVKTYHFVNSKDSTDVDTGIDVTAAVKRIENDTVFAPVLLFDDDSIVEFFGDKDSGLPRSAESVDHDVVREDIQFLLLLALDIGFTCQAYPAKQLVRALPMKRQSADTYKLMSRALRTFVAMNLDVTWIAVNSNVRSPVAAGPSRS